MFLNSCSSVETDKSSYSVFDVTAFQWDPEKLETVGCN